MIEQILRTTRKYLQAFLSTYLPKISDNWWEDCILKELSFSQKQTIKKNNYKSTVVFSIHYLRFTFCSILLFIVCNII